MLVLESRHEEANAMVVRELSSIVLEVVADAAGPRRARPPPHASSPTTPPCHSLFSLSTAAIIRRMSSLFAAGSSQAGAPSTPSRTLQPRSVKLFWQRGPLLEASSYRRQRRSLPPVAVVSQPEQAAPSSAAAASSNAAAGGVPGDEYFASDQRPVILFDGVCNLCNGAVNLMLDWDRVGAFRMAALQSPAGRKLLLRAGRRPDDISSIVLIDRDAAYVKSQAVLRIAQGLDVPIAPLAGLALLVPRFVADPMYDQVANNRYNLLGYRDSCRLSDERFEERFLTD